MRSISFIVSGLEKDDLVDAIEKLGPEVVPHFGHDGFARFLPDLAAFFGSVFDQVPRADVRRHDDDRVLEIDRAPLAVGESAVVENLQQRVEDIDMRLLDLVEENHAVRLATHRFCELAALVVADVTGRRADEPRDGVFLHVFAHVEPDHVLFAVEHRLSQRAGEFGFADAGRAEKNETSRWAASGP